MSILHTVNKSPFSHTTLSSCLKVVQAGDALLLIEDGVYGALETNPLTESIVVLASRGVELYVLSEDLQARGLEKARAEHFSAIDYGRFVELCTAHKSVQSWY